MAEKAKEAGATTAQPEIPAGFTKADTDLDDFPAHEWDKEPQLVGEVLKVKPTVVMRRGKPVDTVVAPVRKDDGEVVNLWHTANLSDLFDNIQPGSEIHITFTHFESLSEGRKMRMFSAYYK